MLTSILRYILRKRGLPDVQNDGLDHCFATLKNGIFCWFCYLIYTKNNKFDESKL